MISTITINSFEFTNTPFQKWQQTFSSLDAVMALPTSPDSICSIGLVENSTKSPPDEHLLGLLPEVPSAQEKLRMTKLAAESVTLASQSRKKLLTAIKCSKNHATLR